MQNYNDTIIIIVYKNTVYHLNSSINQISKFSRAKKRLSFMCNLCIRRVLISQRKKYGNYFMPLATYASDRPECLARNVEILFSVRVN